MQGRDRDKEILSRDSSDIGKLITKGLIDANDVIKAYIDCGDHERAEALRDALKVQSTLKELSIVISKYSHNDRNAQDARRRFTMFNRAYSSINRYEHTDAIDYVGTDICEVGEIYVTKLNRK